MLNVVFYDKDYDMTIYEKILEEIANNLLEVGRVARNDDEAEAIQLTLESFQENEIINNKIQNITELEEMLNKMLNELKENVPNAQYLRSVVIKTPKKDYKTELLNGLENIRKEEMKDTKPVISDTYHNLAENVVKVESESVSLLNLTLLRMHIDDKSLIYRHLLTEDNKERLTVVVVY